MQQGQDLLCLSVCQELHVEQLSAFNICRLHLKQVAVGHEGDVNVGRLLFGVPHGRTAMSLRIGMASAVQQIHLPDFRVLRQGRGMIRGCKDRLLRIHTRKAHLHLEDRLFGVLNGISRLRGFVIDQCHCDQLHRAVLQPMLIDTDKQVISDSLLLHSAVQVEHLIVEKRLTPPAIALLGLSHAVRSVFVCLLFPGHGNPGLLCRDLLIDRIGPSDPDFIHTRLQAAGEGKRGRIVLIAQRDGSVPVIRRGLNEGDWHIVPCGVSALLWIQFSQEIVLCRQLRQDLIFADRSDEIPLQNLDNLFSRAVAAAVIFHINLLCRWFSARSR